MIPVFSFLWTKSANIVPTIFKQSVSKIKRQHELPKRWVNNFNFSVFSSKHIDLNLPLFLKVEFLNLFYLYLRNWTIKYEYSDSYPFILRRSSILINCQCKKIHPKKPKLKPIFSRLLTKGTIFFFYTEQLMKSSSWQRTSRNQTTGFAGFPTRISFNLQHFLFTPAVGPVVWVL